MIKTIKVTNSSGESLVMDLRDPYKTGFLVSSVTGIGPVKAEINTTDVGTLNGSRLSSTRIPERNIIIKIIFMEGSAGKIEDLRQKSYKYFQTTKEVTLEIETDNRKCRVSGYVESNEPDIFSKQESAQISILCTDPAMYSLDDGVVNTVFSGIKSKVYFDLYGESMLEIQNGNFEFGSIENKNVDKIIYDGDIDTGIVMYIHAIGDVGDVTIYDLETRKSFSISSKKLKEMSGTGISKGDDIVISTIKGKKSITLIRNGSFYNIINCVDKNSEWFQLHKGNNQFGYKVTEGATNIQFRIENDILYEGI